MKTKRSGDSKGSMVSEVPERRTFRLLDSWLNYNTGHHFFFKE